MAAFIAMTSWQGEFVEEYAAQSTPDPAQVGMPADDDGSRGDPLLSGLSNAITGYRHDVDAVNAAPTRVVVAVGIKSQGTFAGRNAVATAEALGLEPIVSPAITAASSVRFSYAGEPERSRRSCSRCSAAPS